MRSFVAALFASLLAGCVLFQQPQREASASVALPELWAAAGKGNQGKISTGWIKDFRDKEMERLIDEALENNQNLKAASARLQQAKEGTILGRAARFPSINFGASSNRTRRTETIIPEVPAPTPVPAPAPFIGPDGTLVIPPAPAPAAPTPAPAPFDVVRYNTNYGLSLDASWEVDLWGRLRDLDLASRADFEAAKADFRSARLSLAANAAKSYFDLITAQQQLDLAVKTRDSFKRNHKIIEGNYLAGDATALDVGFSRTNVAAAERDLVGRKLSREDAARGLEVLLGRYPSAKITAGATLPSIKAEIPAGLPSELLMRRPDLVTAAAAVYASARRADAARKDLLPAFRLTGGGSTSSPELSDMLLDPDEIVWNVATSLAQTLYQGGAPRANARRALQQNEEQIRNFASLVLNALREVESALSAERSLLQQEYWLAQQVQQSNLAESQAERDYADGLVGILELLEAQRRAVNSRTSEIVLRNQRLQNRVDLHLALGGDFRTEGDEG